jgi:hypothetical protein
MLALRSKAEAVGDGWTTHHTVVAGCIKIIQKTGFEIGHLLHIVPR